MEGEAETCLGGMLPAVGSRLGAEHGAAGAVGMGGQFLLTTGAFSMLFCSQMC